MDGAGEGRVADSRRRAERAAARLAQDPRVLLVFLFGSTVDPDRRVVRDLDLAVLTDPAVHLDDLTRLRHEYLERDPLINVFGRDLLVMARTIVETVRASLG
jgi:predicted nucleotidyltransferase